MTLCHLELGTTKVYVKTEQESPQLSTGHSNFVSALVLYLQSFVICHTFSHHNQSRLAHMHFPMASAGCTVTQSPPPPDCVTKYCVTKYCMTKHCMTVAQAAAKKTMILGEGGGTPLYL